MCLKHATGGMEASPLSGPVWGWFLLRLLTRGRRGEIRIYEAPELSGHIS